MTFNPESLKNLKPFPPGVSGNPDGKAPGTKNFTSLVRDALQKLATDKDGKPLEDTYEALLIKRVLKKAIQDGDTKMIEILWNYLDGKPRGNIDLGFDKKSLGELTSFFRGMANPDEEEKE